ncbi:MAG: DUF1016 N-terminal domain-containing protein, partial [Bacteroidota bacterium]
MTLRKNNTKLISQIRELILNARQAAYRNVNLLQALTNFLVGKTIVEYEQQGKNRAEYGKAQLQSISRKLTKEFGRGYSTDNLELMRAFYLVYQKRIEIILPPISETVSRKSLGKDSIEQKKSSQALAIKSPTQKSETVSRISSNEKHLQKLSWSHFVLLMKMDEKERRFYEIETAENNWSVRELERQYIPMLNENKENKHLIGDK